MARTRRLHRSGSSGLRSPILKRHRNLKALRLRLVATRQPFGPFCTACRRKRRWSCSSKARHPGRLRTRQQIRPKSWRGWCSSNTRLLNRSPIDENSQFEGSSRRVENPIEPSSSVDPTGPQKKDIQNPAPAPLGLRCPVLK